MTRNRETDPDYGDLDDKQDFLLPAALKAEIGAAAPG